MKKYIILSDLHSNWGALQQLEHIEEFKDENSHIIFAGDYIDGEEQEFEYGIKVLDYVIELVEDKKATALLGNHDEFWVKTSNYNFEAYNLWLLNGGRETFDKNGLKNVDGFLEVVGGRKKFCVHGGLGFSGKSSICIFCCRFFRFSCCRLFFLFIV